MDVTVNAESSVLDAVRRDMRCLSRHYWMEGKEHKVGEEVSMMWQCASVGNHNLMEAMLESASSQHGWSVALKHDIINFRRASDGVSCLYIASQNGHIETAALLLRHGAEVDLSRRTLATPLFIATQRNDCAVAKLLLNHGANLEAENDQRCTPLVLACSMGSSDLVEEFIRRGANTEHKATGLTPAGWAQLRGHASTKLVVLSAIAERRERIFCTLDLLSLLHRWMSFSAVRKAWRAEQIRIASRQERLRRSLERTFTTTRMRAIRRWFRRWKKGAHERAVKRMERTRAMQQVAHLSLYPILQRYFQLWQSIGMRRWRDRVWVDCGGALPDRNNLLRGVCAKQYKFVYGSHLGLDVSDDDMEWDVSVKGDDGNTLKGDRSTQNRLKPAILSEPQCVKPASDAADRVCYERPSSKPTHIRRIVKSSTDSSGAYDDMKRQYETVIPTLRNLRRI